MFSNVFFCAYVVTPVICREETRWRCYVFPDLSKQTGTVQYGYHAHRSYLQPGAHRWLNRRRTCSYLLQLWTQSCNISKGTRMKHFWWWTILVMATVDFYRKQAKFAKVMFLQVSVCPEGDMRGKGGCMAGGMHGRGVCMAGGVHGKGVCMARGCAWQGMPGACMAGRHVWQGGIYEIRSMSRQYASYWNAFLLQTIMMSKKISHISVFVFLSRCTFVLGEWVRNLYSISTKQKTW